MGVPMAEKTHDQPQIERLTFFSDAVFAIAMMLFGIAVKLPPIGVATEASLAQALIGLIPP